MPSRELTEEQHKMWDRLKYDGPIYKNSSENPPVLGQLYHDSYNDQTMIYTGTEWIPLY